MTGVSGGHWPGRQAPLPPILAFSPLRSKAVGVFTSVFKHAQDGGKERKRSEGTNI